MAALVRTNKLRSIELFMMMMTINNDTCRKREEWLIWTKTRREREKFVNLKKEQGRIWWRFRFFSRKQFFVILLFFNCLSCIWLIKVWEKAKRSKGISSKIRQFSEEIFPFTPFLLIQSSTHVFALNNQWSTRGRNDDSSSKENRVGILVVLPHALQISVLIDCMLMMDG